MQAALRALVDDVVPLVRQVLSLEIRRYMTRVTVATLSPAAAATAAARPDQTYGALAKLDQLLAQAAELVGKELIPCALPHLQRFLDDPATAPHPFPLEVAPHSFDRCGVVPASFGVSLPFA